MGSSNKATQDRNLGSTAGGVAGGIAGSVLFPGVGTVIGSTAGSALGGAIGSEIGGGNLLGSSSNSTNNSLDITGLQDIASGQVGIGNIDLSQASTLTNEAGNIYSPAYSQYVSGVTGQLTPAQQALVSQNLATSNLGTEGTYSNLGLGGSTMEGQDLANNQLKSLAEQANINFGNESLGLSGLQTANQYYGTSNQALGNASNAYSGASNALTDAGNLSNANLSALNSAIGSLGNKSSSGLSSLFGSSGGSGLSSLFGGSSGGSTTSAATDVIPAFAG